MRWAVLPEFPNFTFSDSGDVVRLSDGKRLKGYITFDGYIAYRLTDFKGGRKEVFAHRAVASAFLSNPDATEYTQVAHKNGSRINCYYKNLRWASSIQNHADRREHGTGPSGEANPKAKLTDKKVVEIREMASRIKGREIEMKMGELAALHKIHPATLSKIVSGRAWPHIPLKTR